MPRFLPILFAIAVAALTGCQPKDPLDLKISASSPGAYNAWIERHHPYLPLEVQEEFDRSFGKLYSDTAGKIGSTNQDRIQNWLCTRLDGRTIRTFILEGYQVEADAIRTRMVVASNQVLRNVRTGDSPALTPEQQQRFATARDSEMKAIETMRSRLAEIDARVARLSARAP